MFRFVSHRLKKSVFPKYFSEVVKIDYTQLMNKDINLNEQINKAYGREGLGLMIIKNIPTYAEKREKILTLGYKLAQLGDDALKKYEVPEAAYHVGWSRGKSYTESDIEYLCGSFYARSTVDGLKYKNDPEIEKNNRNVWPEEAVLPEFKSSFTDLGKLMTNLQTNLLTHMDRYIIKAFEGYKQNTLHENFYTNHDSISRLIVYYPSNSLDQDILKIKGEKAKKNWAGWHRDFGLVTALTHPMYFTQGNENKSIIKYPNKIKSGLLVKDRQSIIHDVQFEENEVAFQTGDAAFILSGGNIIATPHAVKVTSGIPEDVYRVTFVNFFEPEYSYIMNIPENTTQREIFEKDPFNLVNMMTRFKQGSTYKEFIFSAIDTYFQNEKK